MTDLEALVTHHLREGERRFSRWEGALFEALVVGPGKRLAGNLDGSESSRCVFEAWLGLVVEAIGLGYIRPGVVGEGDTPRARRPENLVELLFVDVLPDKLPTIPVETRMRLLAKAWNLGEGLFGEPPWLNLCVAAAMAVPKTSANPGALLDLEGRLLEILDAALAPRARSTWKGPFAVRTIDLREVESAFLPGRVHFGAPTLVCVHDRKRPDLAAGVLLGARGAPNLAFRSPCLADKIEADPGLPTVTLGQGVVYVSDTRVPLPHWKRGHSVAASRAGLVVATALDSQRLWLVESP
ncbi:MAG TPA: hypothetical protein VM694_01660 [Polyangium sp.]|nr:hypothetical protein [Polyangium sp.]